VLAFQQSLKHGTCLSAGPEIVRELLGLQTVHLRVCLSNMSLRRVPFPIGAFSPSGYIDTLYLDQDLRISKGDKGSIFIARRADKDDA